jgi:hypothetical protein
MKTNRKLKINLTIDSDVVTKAKKLLQARGRSVSSVVEEFLKSLSTEGQGQQSDYIQQDSWLNKFHKKYLKNNSSIKSEFKEPSEESIDRLLAERAKKYT